MTAVHAPAARRALGLLAAGALSVPLLAAPAHAVSLFFTSSGIPVPDDDSGVLPDVSAIFDFDPTCAVGCTLRIDLIYNDTNGGSGLTSNAQVYTGLNWDVLGSISVSTASSDVIAPLLVGPQAATAQADLPDLTIDSVSGDAVTPHWGFRDDLENAQDPSVPVAFDPLGNYLLSSVGDVSFGGAKSDVNGMEYLLPGTPSSAEPNPPNGVNFGVVDPDTTDTPGDESTVFARNTTVAFLTYDGDLDGIENVRFLFGTDGVAIPEPATALLFGLGLVGLAIASPRRR